MFDFGSRLTTAAPSHPPHPVLRRVRVAPSGRGGLLASQVERLDRAPLAGVRTGHVPHDDVEVGPSAELADGLHVDTPT
jgi:hypothetical protein